MRSGAVNHVQSSGVEGSSKNMEIDAAIQQLQSLDEDRKQTLRVSLSFYPVTTRPQTTNILSFYEAGKAIRICREVFKTGPKENYITKMGRYVVWHGTRVAKTREAAGKLLLVGIKDFKVDLLHGRYLWFFVEPDCYVTSFYKSADPIEWKKLNDHKVSKRRIIRVERVLDGKRVWS
jgi:hypothetical protein